jgi:hypothetical protein
MGGDEIRRPPRWADALLRISLNPQEAETESGDLLEAYRDSIYPLRGRWRANLWYVRQILGYVLRARGMKLRNWLLVSLTFCVVTTTFTFLMYPAFLNEGTVSAVARLVAIFLFYGYAATCHTRPKTPEDGVILDLGTRYGIAIGMLWIVGHFGIRLGAGMGVVLALFAFFLPLVAGAHGGIKLWRVGAGMLVGFWSGLISALIVFLWLTVGYLPAFVPGLPGFGIPANHGFAAVEIQEAVGDALVSGYLHVVLGSVFNVIGGTLGGFAGILVGRTGRGPDEPRRILW